MNISEFNSLPIQDKQNFIFREKSVRLISFRHHENQKSTLFDCGSFFAEIYFLPKEKKITKIHGIKLDDKTIDIYIDQMIRMK
jgi:hypothetical protein